jgi:hypothetical protein
MDDRFRGRQPIDAYVEKAADAQTKNKNESIDPFAVVSHQCSSFPARNRAASAHRCADTPLSQKKQGDIVKMQIGIIIIDQFLRFAHHDLKRVTTGLRSRI